MTRKQWINYHHLFYFRTIAMEGGIANAAKKLRLGQPTLSMQIKQFEDVLGHQLFDRSKRKLQITEAGRLVLGYANEIFKLGDEMLDSLNDHHQSEKVRVQLGASDTVPKHLILKAFQKAQQDYNCAVSIITGHSEELLRELRAHRLDLVIANDSPPVGDPKGFYAKNISKMPVVLCGSKKFASLKKGFPESIKGQAFIMPSPYSKIRHNIEHYLKLREINVDIVAEVQDTGVQKLMATHDVGIVPIALPAVEEHLKNQELINLGKLEDVYEELWLVAAQRRIQNPVAATMMKEFSI